MFRGVLCCAIAVLTTCLPCLFTLDGKRQYDRLLVNVHPLGPFTPISTDATATSDVVEDNLIPAELPPLPSAIELAQRLQAQTYVWRLDDSDLEKELWSFDGFVKNNL